MESHRFCLADERLTREFEDGDGVLTRNVAAWCIFVLHRGEKALRLLFALAVVAGSAKISRMRW